MEERERCGSCAEDLSAFLDDELDEQRATELRAHLETCADCRARLDALRRVDAELAALPAPAVPADLRRRLAVRLAAESAPPQRAGRRAAPRRRRQPLTLGAAIASAAAAALALYLAFGRAPRPLPAAPPSGQRVAEIDLDTAPLEEVAIALDLDTIEDLEVIANLELLEALVALEEGTG